MMSNDNSADLVSQNADPSSRNNDLWWCDYKEYNEYFLLYIILL